MLGGQLLCTSVGLAHTRKVSGEYVYVPTFPQPTQSCWKSKVRGCVSSLGAKLLFWQREPSRNHWNSLFVLSCSGKQGLGTPWHSQD